MTAVEDVMEGLNTRTTKGELMDRLERASGIINRLRGKEVKRTAMIEERVRAKWSGKGSAQPLFQLLVQGTETEVQEAVEFLADFEDIVPHFLQRVQSGAKALLEDDHRN